MNRSRSQTRFELIACRNRRWETDAFIDDKQLAVEEARTIIERDPLVTAVRVVMLENHDNGMDERPVCTITAASVRGAAATPPKIPAEIPPKSQPKRRATQGTRRSWSRREIALACAVVAAGVALVSYGLTLPKQKWAFDLPEAQQPHLMRNSFNGEYEGTN